MRSEKARDPRYRGLEKSVTHQATTPSLTSAEEPLNERPNLWIEAASGKVRPLARNDGSIWTDQDVWMRRTAARLAELDRKARCS